MNAEISPADGRQRRGERARAQVIDALLALIDEGDLRPTAPRIAERAGVSPRLVFHHFADLDALLEQAAARQLERVLPTLRPVSPDGPLAARIEAAVSERARLYERVANVRRAALLVEPFSPAVHQRLQQARAWKRLAAERVFARELAARPAGERAALKAAVGHAVSFASWESLRAHQGLTPAAARRAVALTLRSLLEAHR